MALDQNTFADLADAVEVARVVYGDMSYTLSLACGNTKDS